jgi:hypothetical protein
MKTCHLVPTLVIAFGLSIPGIAIARGGHGGGGHGGGGGHSSGAGHSGGGSTAGGHAAGAPASRGPAVAGSPAAPATTSTGQPTTTSGRSGGTVVGTAVPRGSVIGPFTPLGSSVAPSRSWPYYGAVFGGLGLYGGLYNPFGFGYGYGYPPAFGYGYGTGYGYGGYGYGGYGYGGYGYADGFGPPYGGGLGYGGGYGYPNSYADNVFGSSPDSGFSVDRSDPGLSVDSPDSIGPDPVGRPDRTFGAEAYQRDSRGPAGGLRLKIEPRNAEVYVDGDYAGVVDDFDGRFQQLKLAPGLHHIELRAPGHDPLKFDVNIQPRQTTVYQGTFAP